MVVGVFFFFFLSVFFVEIILYFFFWLFVAGFCLGDSFMSAFRGGAKQPERLRLDVH